MNDIKEEQTPQKKINKGKFWSWVISILVIGLFFHIIYINVMYPRGGGRSHLLLRCSGNLRNLGIVITNYSSDHQGHYPQNMEVLITEDYIESLPTCTETDRQYIYQVDGWDSQDFTIFCPSPEEHKLKALYYNSIEGIIKVKK